MIGDGELRNKVLNIINRFDLQANIDVVGYLENPFVIMKNTKIQCMPSIFEGYGLVAVESMMLSVPVVCSGAGGLLDIVDDSCGKICKNKEEYISEINKLLTNENYYNSKKMNSKLKADKLGNIDNYKMIMDNIYGL